MVICSFFFFFKQKTAYEMRISDWSSDVCSSDLDRSLDKRFGVRARDQHIGRDAKRKRPEIARAGDIGDRLAVRPALDQCGESVWGGLGHSVQQQRLARHA